LIGYQANASALDHRALDGAKALHAEDIAQWGPGNAGAQQDLWCPNVRGGAAVLASNACVISSKAAPLPYDPRFPKLTFKPREARPRRTSRRDLRPFATPEHLAPAIR
jgi:hypothetical protein